MTMGASARICRVTLRPLNYGMDAASQKVVLDLEDLYENAPCGYHSVGPDATILRINRTELTWLGRTREEVVGKLKIVDLMAKPSTEIYQHAMQALVPTGDVAEIEIVLVRKDGSIFDAFLRIAAVRDERGIFRYTRASVIDISARKRAESNARIYAEQLQSIAQHVVAIQETERRTLSAELHDRVGQDLAAINLNLHIVKAQLPPSALTKIGPRLDDSISLVDRTVEIVRDVAGALRPLILDDYGLAATLRSYAQQFSERTGIEVSLIAAEVVPRLAYESEMALFRVSQEALTNVLKHAGASIVQITLAADPQWISITIADDGCGCDAIGDASHASRGLGLLVMQERLRAVQGSLSIESRTGAGTVLTARVRRLRS